MSDAIRAAFDAAIKDGKGADEVKVEMIKAGCQFKDTGKFYKEWAIESGIMVDAKERSIKVDEILSEIDGLDTEDGFNDAMDSIMDDIKGTTDRQAGGLIRAWCKKNEVEAYKKPRSSGSRQTGINAKVFVLLQENPHTTEEEMNTFIDENGSETSKKTWRAHYQKIRSLVNSVASS
jgi:hypothetical protein